MNPLPPVYVGAHHHRHHPSLHHASGSNYLSQNKQQLVRWQMVEFGYICKGETSF